MRAPSGRTLRALQQVRQSAAVTVALCDAVLLSRGHDVTDAIAKLPPALRLLIRRSQQALDTLEQEL